MKKTILFEVEVEISPEALQRVQSRSQEIVVQLHDSIRRVGGYEDVRCVGTDFRTGTTFEVIDYDATNGSPSFR